jgi:hypothetical protein
VKAGDGSVSSIIEAGGGATKAAMDIEGVKLTAKMMDQMKEVVSVRPVFRAAMKAWDEGKVGKALGEGAGGKLWGALKSAGGFGSAEIGSALNKAEEATDAMPCAKGVGWALTSRIESYQALFRIAQGTGVGADVADKLAMAGHPAPGWEGLKSALPHAKDG